MTRRSITVLCSLAALCASAAVAQEEHVASPLFSSHDVIELTLEAPLKSIFRERGDESQQYPGSLSYVDAEGDTVRMALDVATRGNFRLRRRICPFAPLQFDFPRSEMEGTLFEGQNKLKLVTHCRDGRDEYRQYVLEEYLIYRVYNLFTDASFRVRLARLTYIDTDEDRDTVTEYGFLIEHKEEMAARNGGEIAQVPVVDPVSFDPMPLGTMELFQYLIGNTDWSPFQSPEGETECCHNAKVVATTDGSVFSVPYDFDQSGIIYTRYSQVNEKLRIRNVRERLYRGICRPRAEFLGIVSGFNERREAIYALYRGQDGLEERQLERTLEYLGEFYETINDERKLSRNIEADCRQM